MKPNLEGALVNKCWLGFSLKEFKEIESDVLEGRSMGLENKFLNSYLAPALLLQGKQKEAIQEYKKWKDKPFGEQGYPTYREAFLDDLNTFEKAGIIPPEVLLGNKQCDKVHINIKVVLDFTQPVMDRNSTVNLYFT